MYAKEDGGEKIAEREKRREIRGKEMGRLAVNG